MINEENLKTQLSFLCDAARQLIEKIETDPYAKLSMAGQVNYVNRTMDKARALLESLEAADRRIEAEETAVRS